MPAPGANAPSEVRTPTASGAELRHIPEGDNNFYINDLCVAERQGFEPWIRFWRILTFQASAFDHSATAPHALEGMRPSLGRGGAQALALDGKSAYRKLMERIYGPAPDAGEIEALARAALARLPGQFRTHLGDVLLRVEEFADAETLAALGIDDPFDLTGLYEGVPLGEKSLAESGAMPDCIRLFRAPILDEWIARGDETLEHLVAHVLIHEVGHHFGLTDADIAALEGSA